MRCVAPIRRKATETEGLVYIYTYIYIIALVHFSKLHKIVTETGAEWPSKLQVAVLAANTCWKRSTDYSPFYLMYGRDANCTHLLEHTNLELLNNEDKEELNNLQFQTFIDEENTFSPELEHPDEWIEPLMEARSQSKIQARENFRKEHQIQKYVSITRLKRTGNLPYRN